jgi:hypothetical protein
MQRNSYWPLNGPSFFRCLEFHRCVFSRRIKDGGRLRVKFRGADGKPTTEPFPKKPLWAIGARNHSNLMVLLFSLNW